MGLKIGLIYDMPHVNITDTTETRSADEQKEVTKKEIIKVLSSKYEVVEILADEKIIERLSQFKIDLAFPLSTGIRGESRQSQVPAILEMLGIPYIGSGILSHALALNKSMAKQIFTYHNVSTPPFQIFYTSNDELKKDLNFPLIVKPACEGSGFGIHKDSVVYSEKDLRNKVEDLLRTYQPPVLVEEFIEGREFTVGVIGNGKDKIILPILEINFDDVPEEHGKFYTFEVKTNFGDKTKYLCPAPLSLNIEQAIKENVSRAFDALGCRDIARVDVRVKDGVPYILEINSLPGLKPVYSDLPKMASKAGLSYEDLILLIVKTAINRIRRYSDERKS